MNFEHLDTRHNTFRTKNSDGKTHKRLETLVSLKKNIKKLSASTATHSQTLDALNKKSELNFDELSLHQQLSKKISLNEELKELLSTEFDKVDRTTKGYYKHKVNKNLKQKKGKLLEDFE